MKKKKSFFHLRLERRVNPPPPSPLLPVVSFPYCRFPHTGNFECSSLVGEYKPAYAALAVKYQQMKRKFVFLRRH